MRNASLWRGLLGVERAVVEEVEFDQDDGVLIAHVRPRQGASRRCGRCGRRGRWYDAGEGRRRWRGLDLGTARVWLEADAPRVSCRRHGVVVAQVPWARHGAGHTYAFDDTVAWLAIHCSKAATGELMRVAWRTVGAIIARVWTDIDAVHDRFAGLSRIGIDEVSYKKHHKYLTVVVDHDTGRLVWAAPGRSRHTLRGFFDALGAERSARITHVSADGADWIEAVVAERCPAAVQSADPFHVVKWAADALDEVRRAAWNRARGALDRRTAGRSRGVAKKLKGARWALWKNPDTLTENQHTQLAWIARTDPILYRAYLLKEGLRHVFELSGNDAKHALDGWISWARRCRIDAFVTLQRRIVKHRDKIHAALETGLSQGRVESVNTKIRLLTRIAFGFHSPHALIALAMLTLGGHRPVLPGRT